MSELVERVEWSPPLETALANDDNDVYLGEQIETAGHAESVSAAHSPGVYVLELSIPEGSCTETYHRLWLQDNETTPGWYEGIVDASRLLYVGFSDNVYERIYTHLEHPNQSTTLSTVFPIHSVVDFYWFDTPPRPSVMNRISGSSFERNTQMRMSTLPDYVSEYISTERPYTPG